MHTTTIEIDPVVRDFATQYFDLPVNHTTIVADALSATKSMQSAEDKYDFIVHDVFTGGAEPIELFTLEFISDLRKLLKDDGSIAIVSTTFILGLHLTLNEIVRTTQETYSYPRRHRS